MTTTTPTNPTAPDDVHRTVREGYGRIADSESTSCGCGCNGSLAERIGYAADELAALPEGADLGLSCGNPTALVSLAPGEVVLDLGSGAGMDAFVAGPKVGAEGRVIGVDMTAQMIERARAGLAPYRERSGLDNVEFRLGEIEHLPVADASVDVVISNCVINLSPAKDQVWREIARVLKPGGRVAISDLALLQPLPEGVLDSVEALVGCVAGAVPVDEHQLLAEQAGLETVAVTPRAEYAAALDGFEDETYAAIAEQLPEGTRASDFITSLDVTASKPAAQACCAA